jgi:hypothetical protein
MKVYLIRVKNTKNDMRNYFGLGSMRSVNSSILHQIAFFRKKDALRFLKYSCNSSFYEIIAFQPVEVKK